MKLLITQLLIAIEKQSWYQNNARALIINNHMFIIRNIWIAKSPLLIKILEMRENVETLIVLYPQ